MKNSVVGLCSIIFLSSCAGLTGDYLSGNGNVETEDRNVGDFHGVKTSGSIDVEIQPGESYAVSVENDENILSSIVTEVEDGTLNIHYKQNTSVSNDHAKVYVTAPSLNQIKTSGSADISIKGIIKNDSRIEIAVSGSGDINGGVDAPEIEASIGGSGNISLHGRTKDFDARISGSGDFKCADLKSENTRVRISGSGNAHIFASAHLEAKVSGSGDIFYRGNPPSPDIQKSGSGSVRPE